MTDKNSENDAAGCDFLSNNPAARDGRENIKVLVRIRPLLGKESGPVAKVVGAEGKEILVTGATANKRLRCRYDAVIGPDVSQEDMASHVRECTTAVLDGENSTIFAYGQTGSGKTYTMFGPETTTHHPAQAGFGKGVIPQAVDDIFKGLASRRSKGDESSIWVSLIQLYNEQLYDMLRDPHRVNPLAIHQQPEAGIYVQGLSEYAVHNFEECLQLLRIGKENRAIRETQMNQASSRSHSIFQVVVEQKRRSEHDGERTLKSKFNLVDLAGSEKWDIKQDMEEAHVNEMTNINVSLYTLGRVIAALSTTMKTGDGERSRQPHIPYRDSKLTRLLQDSLGGNTRTCIIATLSPARECVDETISTLRFADRAKQVMTFVQVNEHRPVDHALVQSLKAEIKDLRGLLQNTNRQREGATDRLIPRSAAFAATAEADMLAYRETIEKLRRENDMLREKRAGTNGKQLGADIAGLQDTNRTLKDAIRTVIVTIKRFFRFEIEEEELRNGLSKVIVHLNSTVPGGMNWDGNNNSILSPPRDIRPIAPTPRRYNRHESSTRHNGSAFEPAGGKGLLRPIEKPGDPECQMDYHRGNSMSLPPVLSTSREPKAEKLSYRLRGKHADEVVVVQKKDLTGEEEERRIRKELKLAKHRMKKNLQLQEWLVQREQHEMEILAIESARRKAAERDRQRKDEEFRRRAARQKAKLKRFYDAAEMEARKETDAAKPITPSETKTTPENSTRVA